MAGRPSHDALIGVGTALRKARDHRGLTLDEAARDTKLRVDQLRALEDEDFDALGGEVYARAALRTYAAYLGLDPAKVMGVYARHADEPEPPQPPGKTGRVERAIAATRVRDNQRFLLIAAAAVIFVLIVFGLLSRDHAAPTAATIAAETPSLAPTDQAFDATLTAEAPAQVTVTVDGEAADVSDDQGGGAELHRHRRAHDRARGRGHRAGRGGRPGPGDAGSARGRRGPARSPIGR